MPTQKFSAEASAPVILNIIMILSIIGAKYFGTNVAYTLVWAIFFAGFVQLFYLYRFCRIVGFRLRLVKPHFSTELKSIFKIMSVNSLSAAIMQINLFIDLILASWLPTGSMSYLFYADRIFQLPLSVIGIALGSVLLPNFSKLNHQPDEQKRLLKNSLIMAFQISAPAAVGVCVLSNVIIHTLFCRGEFTQSHSVCTGSVLWAYGLSLPAYVMSKVFNSYYYAHKKPWIPMRASVISVVTNLIGSIALMQIIGMHGYGVGYVLCCVVKLYFTCL